MRKHLHAAAALLFMLPATFSFAQRKCSSHEHFQEQLAADPNFVQQQRNIETFTENYVKRGGSAPLVSQVEQGTPLYTIPVVVHVVYNTAAQNISDAQIQSQIDVLNKDFQLLNSDVSGVPSAFQPLVADCKIQFCLAKRDPSGNATTGIIRKSTTVTSFSTNDNVKRSANGGSDAWDRNQYLNLWVCNISGGILGYAQFPGGAAATDGVVITYTGFGTTGTAAAPFNLGRTATHEVGHWLNLRHIWGDDGTGCSGSDLVGDTPNQADENYGCPSFPAVSCSNGPNGDLFMNYMDYTDDRCMYMFTVGQRDRMYGVLQAGGARASLASSQGCTPPAGGGCAVPVASAGSVTQTGATISWAAVSGAVNYSLQYKTAAASTYTTVSVSGTSYALSGLTAGTTYNYQVRTNCSGSSSAYSTTASFTTGSAGCTDAYEANNTLATAATIPVNTAIPALISTSTDRDYFKFTTTSAQRDIRVTLTGLAADYDVRLYNSSGTQVGISQNGGTSSETIVYNNGAAGVYTAYVYGYNGVFSTTACYSLKAEISANNFRDAGAAPAITKQSVTVYPQPAKGLVTLSFDDTWKGVVNISVSGQTGANMRSLKLNVENHQASFDASAFAGGMYYLRISNGEQSVTQKLLIQR